MNGSPEEQRCYKDYGDTELQNAWRFCLDNDARLPLPSNGQEVTTLKQVHVDLDIASYSWTEGHIAIDAEITPSGTTWTDMFGDDVNQYILSIAVEPLYNLLILDGQSLQFTGGVHGQFVHAVCVKDAVEG